MTLGMEENILLGEVRHLEELNAVQANKLRILKEQLIAKDKQIELALSSRRA